jgi:hypothetical protein
MLKLSETDIKAILEDTRLRYPRAWGNAHREGHDERYDYIVLATKALQAANVRAGGSPEAIGGNWRRAVVGDKSMDGVSVLRDTDGRYYFEDVIAGAGGPNPSIKYRHPFNTGRCSGTPPGTTRHMATRTRASGRRHTTMSRLGCLSHRSLSHHRLRRP